MTPDLGLVDARFGRIWSEEERSYVVSTLAAAGYNFYHYGPKADRALRRDWRQSHTAGRWMRWRWVRVSTPTTLPLMGPSSETGMLRAMPRIL